MLQYFILINFQQGKKANPKNFMQEPPLLSETQDGIKNCTYIVTRYLVLLISSYNRGCRCCNLKQSILLIVDLKVFD